MNLTISQVILIHHELGRMRNPNWPLVTARCVWLGPPSQPGYLAFVHPEAVLWQDLRAIPPNPYPLPRVRHPSNDPTNPDCPIPLKRR